MILERLFGESFIKVASCTDTRSSSLTPLLTMPPSALLAVSLWGVQIEYTGMDGAFLAPLRGRDAAIDAASTTWLQRRWLAERGGIKTRRVLPPSSREPGSKTG